MSTVRDVGQNLVTWTHVEWTALGSVLSGAGTLAGACAVIAAAVVGSRTFDSWRRQKLAERRLGQAERILTATYKARRGLSFIRNSTMWGHELAAAEEMLRAAEKWPDKIDEQNAVQTAQAYYNRITAEAPNRQELAECQPMARALFGEELELAIERLGHQFHTVRVYVDANARDRGDPDRPFRRKIDGALYEGFLGPDDEQNEMDKVIADTVELIEKTCIPAMHLDGEGWRNR